MPLAYNPSMLSSFSIPFPPSQSIRKVPKQEFLSQSGPMLSSFTHSEGKSPNKKILAVFVHPNGYETFGFSQDEGWKHYLFN